MSQAKGGRFEGPTGLLIGLVAVIAAAALLERLTRPADHGERTGPIPLPELNAQGWLNTGGRPGPTVEELRGRFVVVDCWDMSCRPCVQALPGLARFYSRWRDRGVEVIGVTTDPQARVPAIESLVDRIPGMDWPIAYGAGLIHQQLGVSMIPTYVLFDPDGVSVWRGHSIASLEEELASRY